MKQALQVAQNKGAMEEIKLKCLFMGDLSPANYKYIYENELQERSILQAVLCRFYYLGINEAIPSTLEGRARYWKKYYNSELGAGTPEKYISRVRSFKNEA